MAKNWINDSTPWKNNIFLDLPFLREVFTDPNTSQRADIYHTRQNTEQANKLLEAIKNKDQNIDIQQLAQTLGRPQEEMQGLIQDLIWNQKNSSYISEQQNLQTQAGLDDISSHIARGTMEVKSTLEQILGHEIPQDIPLHMVGKQLTAESKQSLVALATKGAIHPEKLAQLISPQFAHYMKEGVSSKQARKMQESILLTLQALKNGTSTAHRRYNEVMRTETSYPVRENQLQHWRSIIDEQTQKYSQLAQQLIPEDELALLDVVNYAKDKSLGDLLADNTISPAVASRFAKNNILDGRFAKIMTNMFDHKDGKYRPLVEMDGVAGIGQWTKANALMQRTLVDQGILSLSNQDRALMKQDTTNKFLDTIDKTIAYGVREFHDMRIQTHEDLGQIDKSINTGFTKANKHLGNINKNVKSGFDTANTYLKNMDTNIFYGFQGTHNLLSHIHKELRERHHEVGVGNQYLAYAGQMLDSINTGIEFANEQLGGV